MHHAKIYEDLTARRAKLAVIGLGYVGLPIALEFAKHISVIGFDINSRRIGMMRNQIDPSKEVDAKEFAGRDITFTDDEHYQSSADARTIIQLGLAPVHSV